MRDVAVILVGLVVGGGMAWVISAAAARRRFVGQVRRLLAAVRKGDPGGAFVSPEGAGSAVDVSPLRELAELLDREWVPRSKTGGDALSRALRRTLTYIRHRVEAPLLAGLEEGGSALRRGAEAALDAVEDFEFFLESAPPPAPREREGRDLVALVGEVVREFVGQADVAVKVTAPEAALRVPVHPEALKDALFLLLHNAGEFGGGTPVQVSLERSGRMARLRIQDRGPGFSAEALEQAFDPFYSTSPEGLGLGLPHARSLVRAMGGEISLRNREGGGAEVEVLLPISS